MENIKDKEYLTVSEAAQLLGFTRDGVYKLIYRGLLKAHRITSHWTVIYRKDNQLITCRCNYSIFLIVSRLRFKSTKLIFTRSTPPILTIPALLKHPSLLTANITIFAYSCKFVLVKNGG